MDTERSKLAIIAVACLFVGASGVVVAFDLGASVHVSGGVPIGAPDGMTVTLEGSTQANLEDISTLGGTVNIVTEDGNASFYSPGEANATVHATDIEGTWTNITSIDADQNTIQIDPDDKSQATVGKEIDAFAWRSGIAANDGAVDFVYNGTSGNSRVTVRGLAGSTDYAAIDASTNEILDIATSNSAGAITFDELDNSEHSVLIQSDDTSAPVLSNPVPVGPQNSSVSTFEIDVNDADFPQGDTVTAELFVKGDSKGTDTLTSNGTASVSHTVDLGSSIDFSWVATDDWGNEQIENYTLTTPVNVTIREEHNASKVVTGANATITLYSDDATIVVERADTNDDGNISLEGLPDKEFVAVVESDDHYTRRVYIDSIYEQQSIFLLNQTAVPGDEAVNTTFVFEDRSGNFDPENTTLRVQRALDLNDDGESEWLTVAGDFWGAASEFPFTGEENARYRLIVENEEGDRRVLGTHIPTDDGVKTVVNGDIEFSAEEGTGRYFDASVNKTENRILAMYADPTNQTSDVRIRVWQLGNRSNEIHDQNYTNGPYGELGTFIDVTGDQAEMSWVVRYDATHDTDGSITGQVTVGAPGVPLPIDPWLLASFVVIGITFAGTLYGPRTALMGSWVLLLTAMGATAFGWLAFPMASLVAAFGIAAGGTFYREALP